MTTIKNKLHEYVVSQYWKMDKIYIAKDEDEATDAFDLWLDEIVKDDFHLEGIWKGVGIEFQDCPEAFEKV